jgi:hypothetical protein
MIMGLAWYVKDLCNICQKKVTAIGVRPLYTESEFKLEIIYLPCRCSELGGEVAR